MAELSFSDQVTLSRITGNMMSLLQLDDAWTHAVQRPAPNAIPPLELVEEMHQRLQQMGEAASFIGSLSERMGVDFLSRFEALMWGDGLSTADRDDLRWLVLRTGDATDLTQVAAGILSEYQHEQDLLAMQVERFRKGETVEGDLSREYRCGLGTALLVSGAAALPSAAGAGAAAAFAAGAAGAVAAGVAVGATGGVAAIAIIVAGLLVIRRAKC